MDHLYFSFICIAPFIIYLGLGFISKKALKIKSESFSDLNSIAFYYLLPASLFLNIYQADFKQINFSLTLIVGLAGVILTFLISMIIYGIRKLPNEDKGVMIQNAYRSNFVLFGIPLVENILGYPASGLAGVMMAIFIPLFNIFATIALSIYSRKRKSFLQVFFTILTNPLIIASLFAFILQIFKIQISDFFISILKTLGTMATPLALIALGGQFSFESNGTMFKHIIEAILIRLLFVPGIFLSIAIYMGIREESLALLLVLFGAPVAVNSYTMAVQMDANDKLAGKIVVYTTLTSIFTLFLFISIFKKHGFF